MTRFICGVLFAFLFTLSAAPVFARTSSVPSTARSDADLPKLPEIFRDRTGWKEHVERCRISSGYTHEVRTYIGPVTEMPGHAVPVPLIRSIGIFSIVPAKGNATVYRLQAISAVLLTDGSAKIYLAESAIFVRDENKAWKQYPLVPQEAVEAALALDHQYLRSLGVDPKAVDQCEEAPSNTL